jgi:hypothetical protein
VRSDRIGGSPSLESVPKPRRGNLLLVAVAHHENCICGACSARRRGEQRRAELEEARKLREVPVLCGCGCGQLLRPGAELRAYVNGTHKQRAYRLRQQRARFS